jgi:hypothetical protein
LSWFLTKNRKKAAGRGRRKKNPIRQAWDARQVWRLVQPVLAVAALVGVGFAWGYGKPWLVKQVGGRLSEPVTAARVELNDSPAWMSEGLKQHLQGVVAGAMGADPLDPAGLARAAASLQHNPWVKQVQRVERTKTGVIAVADYREPIALVESRDGYRLVDREGVQLPGVYRGDLVGRVGLPVITGVHQPSAGEGRAWPGDDLAAGLSLVQSLSGEPYFRQIQAFDVGRRDDRGRVRLALRTRGGYVRWGLPPGKEEAVEPDAATKIKWLRSVNQRRGSIDAGGKVVDVFGGAVFVHQPSLGDGDERSGYSSR